MKPKRLVVVRYRKDRGKWEVDAIMPPGSIPARTRNLYDTEEAATTAAAELAPRLSSLEPVRDQHLTLAQAFDRYYQAKVRKKSLDEDKRIAAHLIDKFGGTTRLRDLTASRIARYRAARLTAKSVRRKDKHGKATPLGAASINRPLALLRHLLRLAAQDWEVIPKVPVVRLEKEPQGRIRCATEEEDARLFDECKASQNPHLFNIVKVAEETGMRYGEITGLTWDRVDLSRGVIRLEVTKGGKRREIPMRDIVYKILSTMPEPRKGRVWPDKAIRTAFENAVERAKIEDFHFHDLRHTFASRFMMNGGSLLSLSRILGHATLAMTTRYAHLSPDHLRGEMEKTAVAAPRAAARSVQKELTAA
jgi:integrase